MALDFAGVVRARRSCRAFRPEPVDDEVLDQLFSLAQKAPSWCNVQPWQGWFTSGATTRALREALLDAAITREPKPDLTHPGAYGDIHLQRRRAAGRALYQAVGVERRDQGGRMRQERRNFEFFDAPHVLVLGVDRTLGPYGVLDLGVYLAHLLLAAESLGLGSIAQAALAMYPDVVRAVLDIPENHDVVVGVSLGYADDAHPANSFVTERAPWDSAVQARLSRGCADGG